jgi:acyl-[acyl-carrier-protein]-phospholipid O-acyltransferase/long-chain-fatty-acid--[acyl-carrier-protein] ligase
MSRERLQAAAKDLGQPELAVPRRIVQVAALPLLGTGKIDYVSVKKMAENLPQAQVQPQSAAGLEAEIKPAEGAMQ